MHVIDVLARHGVEFVVIGGFAAELHRAPVPRTQDIDVTPRVSEANLARLSAALVELEARVRATGVPEGLAFSHDAASLARVGVWNLTTSVGDFDLSFRPTGTGGYEDLATNAIVVHFAGHDVAVAALADVVRSKEAAGRPKDLATLPALHRRLDTLEGANLDELRSGVLQVLNERQKAASQGEGVSRIGQAYPMAPGVGPVTSPGPGPPNDPPPVRGHHR